ncbi:PD40 domain-containing protein [bacterium]|nr:PD40 domain-containing protein [bacterium]
MLRKLILFCFYFLVITSAAGQTYFGKNKIQYHKFKWQVLKTDHFDIYFYPEMDDLAEIGAAYAELAYDKMQNKLNHTVPRRIPLVFYSSHFHFEETNTLPFLISPGIAGFFEFIKGRVVIPCVGSLPDFRHTIQHEIIHVFQRSFIQRTMQDHRQNVYRGLPLWFTEGQAEYWSEGWDSDAEMILRDGILNDSFVPITAMYRIQGTYMMYKEGQSFLKFLAEEYGEGILIELMRNIWRENKFSDVFEITLGRSLKEVGRDWEYDLQKKYYPLLKNADLVRHATRAITKRGYHTMPVTAKNDSINVYFVANRDGYPGIYHVPFKASPETDPVCIVRSEHEENIESLHLNNSGISVNNRRLLAFAAKQEGQDHLNIYDINKNKMICTTVFDSLISIFSPAWSPDGNVLAFTGLDYSGRSDLYTYNYREEVLQRLTYDYFDDRDPDWSPDGHRLVFSSDRVESNTGESSNNLFMVNVHNKNISRLTTGAYQDKHPTWSHDGKAIAFSSDRDGISNIWLVLPDQLNSGPVVSQLTRLITGAFYPCWTPGGQIIFSGFDHLSFHLYAIDHPDIDQLEFETQKFTDSWKIMELKRIKGSRNIGRHPYKKKFTLDFAQSQIIQDPIYGTGGGGQFLISDLMSDELYHCMIYNNSRSASNLIDGFNVAVTRVDQSRRLNYALGLYRLAGRYYNHYEGYFYSERVGGMASISYPLNKFERIETSVNMRYFTKDHLTHELPLKAFLLSNYISYSKDNSLWGATGPIDGERIHFKLGNSVDIQNSSINFTTLIGDYRRYTRLGGRISHAVRIWGQFNHGKEALPYTLGGSWNLRGYRLWSLWGTKLAFVSNEIRFPILDVLYLKFPFGGLGFQYINGALFVDAGNVWDKDFGELKGSFGLGFRMRFGGFMVLRWDIGRRTDFKSIESKTFSQFFFGWDF